MLIYWLLYIMDDTGLIRRQSPSLVCYGRAGGNTMYFTTRQGYSSHPKCGWLSFDTYDMAYLERIGILDHVLDYLHAYILALLG